MGIIKDDLKMCCLFNFMQYLFSFFHKLVTGVIFCVMSYVVCCVMLFAVTAGVALGYNYSVSEYMEHKDTNVSVQLQRGIFPEKVDQSRRRGGGPVGPDQEEDVADTRRAEKTDLLKDRMLNLEADEVFERNLQGLTEKYKTTERDQDYNMFGEKQSATSISENDERILEKWINKLKALVPNIVLDDKNNTQQGSTKPLNVDFQDDESSPEKSNEYANRIVSFTSTLSPIKIERPVEKREDFRSSGLEEEFRKLLKAAQDEKVGYLKSLKSINQNRTLEKMRQEQVVTTTGGQEERTPPGYEADDVDEESPLHYRPVRRRRSLHSHHLLPNLTHPGRHNSTLLSRVLI